MLLEPVLTTSPHLFGSSFSKFGGHGGELSTCLSLLLYLARLCSGAKLNVWVGMGLYYRHCEGFIGWNTVAFNGNEAGNLQANISVAESIVNVEITKNLLCFICDDEEGDKVLSRVIDISERETFATVFSNVLVYDPLLK